MRDAARPAKSAAAQRASRQPRADRVAPGEPVIPSEQEAAWSARHRQSIGRPRVVAQDWPDDPDEDRQETRARRAPRRASDPDPTATSPHFTLPSIPLASTSTRKAARAPRSRRNDPRPPTADEPTSQRTLLGGQRARKALRDLPDLPQVQDDPWEREQWDAPGWDGEDETERRDDVWGASRSDTLGDSTGRRRAASAARPLPALRQTDPRLSAERIGRALDTMARASVPALSTASVPDLIAFRPAPRRRVNTRMVLQKARDTARSPWSIVRLVLIVLATLVAVSSTHAFAGEPAQPLMVFQAQAGAGPAGSELPLNSAVSRVQAETQMRRSDLYDTVGQFNQWGGAACSAAVLSEVLTAYGVQGATIGRMIDELGSNISPQYGLLTYDGFSAVAAKHGFRADLYVDKPLTYKQMLYITNTLGLPVIINVRISYGYFHFFAGGHFLVMTAGDNQGVRIVDSSLYYVKYLPLDVLNSMFTQRTVVIVPKDFQYTLPA